MYNFVDVADSGPDMPYNGFPTSVPAVNLDGTVVFPAQLNTGDSVLVTRTRAGDYSTIATAKSFGVTVGINDSGTVAFVSTTDSRNYELQTAKPGGSVATIGGTPQGYNPYNLRLTNTGAIVFTTSNGISVADPSGTVRPLLRMGQNNFTGFGAIPSMNDAGTIAFSGFTTRGGGIWLRAPGGQLTEILGADVSTPGFGPYQSFQDPVINASGQIAISASRPVGGGKVQDQLLLYTPGKGFALLVDDGAFNHLGIADDGTVAFEGGLPGVAGIFTGSDPLKDKVIAYGDPLFGSAVTGLTSYSAINNNGDIAFQYGLSDGREGIAVAYAVPAPPGDANRDGRTDFADLLRLAQNYGISAGAGLLQGDFNGDGSVGFDDLLILAQHYGEAAPADAAASPLPEPGAVAAVVMIALSGGRRRRHEKQARTKREVGISCANAIDRSSVADGGVGKRLHN